MARIWYCLIGDREYGPMEGRKLRKLAAEGRIARSTPVRIGPVGDWFAAAKVRGLFGEHLEAHVNCSSGPDHALPLSPADGTESPAPRLRRLLRGSPDAYKFAPIIWALAGGSFVAAFVSVRAFLAPPPLAASVANTAVHSQASLRPTHVTSDSKGRNNKRLSQLTGPDQDKAAVDFSRTTNRDRPAAKKMLSASTPMVASVEKHDGGVIANAERAVVTILTDRCQGSGFVIDKKGWVATNYHVIEGAKWVNVRINNSQHTVSGWLAFSTEADLAILQISAPLPSLQPLALDVELPKKASSVYALGSPLGLEGTLSSGIVSAVREGDLPGRSTDDDSRQAIFWIQTTTPISPGSSGGPLLDVSGNVIGVNSISRRKGQNLNFAVSSRHLSQLANQVPTQPYPFSELPLIHPPQTSTASGDPPDDGVQREAAARAVATAINQSIERTVRAQADNDELNRIVKRAGDLEASMRVIEAEGTRLEQRRNESLAQGRELTVRVAQLQLQEANLSSSLYACALQIRHEQANNRDDRASALAIQYAEMDAQRTIVSHNADALAARGIALNTEAVGLWEMMLGKRSQLDSLVAERELLRKRYEAIVGASTAVLP